MSDPSQRRPWTEGPDEEAPPESWLGLDDDELLHRVETLDADAETDEDDRLIEVVTSDRHFFIRQEAAKRVRDRRRLYAFEDDRHVGQILVRHLARREDLTYLERTSMLSRHVEVRQAAQVQLARVWRRLEKSQPRDTRPIPRVSLPGHPPPPVSPTVALPKAPQATPVVIDAPLTSAPLDGDQVDGSLLGWAAHFLVEQVWNHLGTATTREVLLATHGELASSCATLSLFSVGQDARVMLDLESGPRISRAAVHDVARWMVAFRQAARRVAPDAAGHSVRASTALMADALRAAGFYSAFDEAEAALRP